MAEDKDDYQEYRQKTLRDDLSTCRIYIGMGLKYVENKNIFEAKISQKLANNEFTKAAGFRARTHFVLSHDLEELYFDIQEKLADFNRTVVRLDQEQKREHKIPVGTKRPRSD